jgi:hypothetical protein
MRFIAGTQQFHFSGAGCVNGSAAETRGNGEWDVLVQVESHRQEDLPSFRCLSFWPRREGAFRRSSSISSRSTRISS